MDGTAILCMNSIRCLYNQASSIHRLREDKIVQTPGFDMGGFWLGNINGIKSRETCMDISWTLTKYILQHYFTFCAHLWWFMTLYYIYWCQICYAVSYVTRRSRFTSSKRTSFVKVRQQGRESWRTLQAEANFFTSLPTYFYLELYLLIALSLRQSQLESFKSDRYISRYWEGVWIPSPWQGQPGASQG